MLIYHRFQGPMNFSKRALETVWGFEVKFLETISNQPGNTGMIII